MTNVARTDRPGSVTGRTSKLTALLLATSLLAGSMSGGARADSLVINTDRSGAGQKAAMNEIVERFKQKNPGTDVAVNFSDVESYKTAIRNFLVASPPDIAFWFTGARMRAFTKRGLLDDMTGFLGESGLKPVMAPFIPAVTDADRQMMMPTNYYSWEFFYNKEVFAKEGISPPKTWDELMAAAAKLKQAGITPFAIGTRDLWANDLWFDYLDMRINGLDFHMQLMDGKIKYTDPRVKTVFERWKSVIDKGFFLDNASSYGWQEAIPFLSQGKAGMYLLGAYVMTSLPEEARKNIGYFRFPTVDPSVPDYEEVSVNGALIPTGAKNKEAARKFLAFFAEPENLKQFALAGASLPARTDVDPGNDPFIQEQVKIVSQAKGSAQFYDRDTDPEMAQVGMRGFQEFLAHPDQLDAILTRLEAARARIFK